MKKCSWCGKEYPDEALFCAADGRALQPVLPPNPPVFPQTSGDRQQLNDTEHIKLLSIFHFVVGGLACVGIFFLFVHYFLLNSVFSNPDMWKSKNGSPPPQSIMNIFIIVYFIIGVLLAVSGVLNLLSGLFLRQRKHRMFSLVVGCLNCLHIPFGTILGVFTIMVLTRNSVRETYPPE
jgi:hypothetical protein